MDRQNINKEFGHALEQFPPPANLPPSASLWGRLAFAARKMADLQVASVLQHLVPWLREIEGHVLELGCGGQPYRHYISSNCIYRGLDWEKTKEYFGYEAPDTIYYNGDIFPFEDGSFDNIFHTEVLEHVYNVDVFLSECRRVLKTGGAMFFSIPFQARYHYIPYDYWRFTPAALRCLLIQAGFKEITIVSRGNDISVAIYKNISVIYRWVRSGIIGKVFGVLSIPILIVLLLWGHFSLNVRIGSKDDCLGYIVIAR